MEISVSALREYLSQIFGGSVEITGAQLLGRSGKPEEILKAYGYGLPLRLDYTLRNENHSVVLNTVKPDGFGHENMSDRAAILLWQAEAFKKLPKHVRPVDVGAFTIERSAMTLGDCAELFLLTELVEGSEYYRDLDRIRDTGTLTELDVRRCRALAEYLAEIHTVKRSDPGLYQRRIRELVGHSECIMGLADSYPADADYITPQQLADIEKRCVDWRWCIKPLDRRLSQVHGDFHPWNVLFREGVDFTVLDRSRGEWGEPADDVAAMAINYLFYSLQHLGILNGPFKELWDAFFETYLAETNDRALFQVVQPFFCWRALVVASPVWYPNLAPNVRRGLLNFAGNVLGTPVLDLKGINALLEAAP